MIDIILQVVEDGSQLAIWSPLAKKFIECAIVGIKLSAYYQKTFELKFGHNKADISDIDKRLLETLRLENQVDDVDLFGNEILRTNYIYIDFNRSLKSSEYDDFFNEEAASIAYSECSVGFLHLEINDNWDGICVELQDEYTRNQIAKFSVFIDGYLRSIGKELYVEKVYMLQ